MNAHLWTYTDRLGGAQDRDWLIDEIRDELIQRIRLTPAELDTVEDVLRGQLDGERA